MAVISSQSRESRSLERSLSAWDARLRLVQSVVWLPRGLIAGLAVALALAIAARLWPLLPRDILLALAGVFALMGIVGALLGVWLWRRTPLQLARRFDRVYGLKERMSTALELAHGVIPAESEVLTARQVDQALRVASRVRAAEGQPLRANWREWIAPPVGIAAVALAILLPNPQEAALDQRVAIQQAISQELQELRDLREEVVEDESLTPEEEAAILETLDEAIQTLEQRGVTQEEAVAALDAAQQELRDLSAEMAAEQQQALEEASASLNGTPAQQAADALAQGDMAAAAEALENLDLESMSPEEQQALAEALEQAAEALEGTNPDAAEALGEAAESLQQGDAASAEQALGEAGEAMGQGGQGGGQSTAEVEEYADKVQKSEQGVAQAGRGEGNQPGEGGMGQAQPGQGEGQGQGQQPGQQGSSGSGRGEGDGDPDQGGQAGDEMPTDNGPGDGGESTFDDIYSPQRIGGEGGEQVDMPGNPDPGLPTGQEGDFADNPEGDANVPYNEVYGDYEGAVNEALDSGYVPLGLRDLIRSYFTRLDPTEN